MPKVIRDDGERSFVVHSEVSGPIRELSFLRRSLLFAELSMISYNDPDEASEAAGAIGFGTAEFFDNDGSQAYRFENDHDCVIASRGTEPNEWNDIQADANASTVLAETAGRVHRGFKKEVDDLWPMVEEVLKTNEKPLWFCGHSLGGAMATICAGRCFLSHIGTNPEELYSFGSPRVGDKRYVNYVRLIHYRWVNNNDIVTRVPPPWFGYRHTGSEVYLDYKGRIRKIEGLRKTKDRFHGFLRGLRKFKVDHFSDHSIHEYVLHILQAVKEEEDSIESESVNRAEEIVSQAEEAASPEETRTSI